MKPKDPLPLPGVLGSQQEIDDMLKIIKGYF